MGLAAGVVVAVTAVAAVTVMPALLGMAGRRVLGRRGAPRESGRFAERWARGVARRPVLSALAGVALLLALAAPVLGLRLGQPDDGTKPASMTQKVAYDRLAEGFGAGFNGPLVLAVALPASDDGTLERLEAGAKAAPGVAAVSEPVVNEAGDAATLTVIPQDGPAGRGDVAARLTSARARSSRPRARAPTSAARPRRSRTWPTASASGCRSSSASSSGSRCCC